MANKIAIMFPLGDCKTCQHAGVCVHIEGFRKMRKNGLPLNYETAECLEYLPTEVCDGECGCDECEDEYENGEEDHSPIVCQTVYEAVLRAVDLTHTQKGLIPNHIRLHSSTYTRLCQEVFSTMPYAVPEGTRLYCIRTPKFYLSLESDDSVHPDNIVVEGNNLPYQ